MLPRQPSVDLGDQLRPVAQQIERDEWRQAEQREQVHEREPAREEPAEEVPGDARRVLENLRRRCHLHGAAGCPDATHEPVREGDDRLMRPGESYMTTAEVADYLRFHKQRPTSNNHANEIGHAHNFY